MVCQPRASCCSQSKSAALLREQSLGDLVHCPLVVVAWEQVPIAIHCDLKRGVAGECLDGLRGEPRLYPR